MASFDNDPLDLDEDTQRDRFLTFNLDSETYGIEIKYILEIIGVQNITEIPELPEYVKGIINLRGNIIPVLDVRSRFKKEPKEYNDRTCIIVVNISEISIGLIVDSVSEVITITEDNIVEPSQFNKVISNRYIKEIGRIGEKVILILNCEKFMTEEEIESLNDKI